MFTGNNGSVSDSPALAMCFEILLDVRNETVSESALLR